MGDKPRILVVDDELGVRESVRIVLQPQYDVETVENGEAALESLSTFRPDLVVMDLKMPTIGGLEVLERIKAHDSTIEVVMITAYASLETLRQAVTDGAFEYLIKPFSRRDLEETVRRALARRGGERGAEGHTWIPGPRGNVPNQSRAHDLLTFTEKGYRFDALARLAQAVTSSLSLSEVLDRVARAAIDLLPDSSSQIWIVEGSNLMLGSEAGTLGPPRSGRKIVFAIGEGLTGDAAASRQPLIVEDVVADPRTVNVEWMQQEGYLSLVSIPLLIRDRLVGVLTLLTRHRHRFVPEELEILGSFGTHAAIAIENARLYQRADARSKKLRALSMLTRLITSTRDHRAVFRAVAEAAVTLLGAKVANVWVADPEARILRVQGEFTLDSWCHQLMINLPAIPYGQGVVGEIFESGVPQFILDVQDDARWLNPQLAQEAGLHAYAGFPLVSGDLVVGVLSMFFADQRPFTPEEIELISLLADHGAIAIETARLLQELTNRQARLEALLEVSRQLSRFQPVKSLLESIAEACGHLLGSDSVGFRLVEGDELVLTGRWGNAAEATPTLRLRIGESLSGMVATTGEPLVITDVANDPRVIPAHREARHRLGYRALLAVPVKVGEHVAGVLTIGTRKEAGFSKADVAIASAFAAQAAVALENSRLYQETRWAYDQLSQTHEQLIQAQKMEAVGRLAGGIAHDFNNLLTIVMGRSQLMLGRLQADDPLRRDLALIDATMTRAATLTQQLLAFSRKQVLQPKVLDLNTVVANIDPMLRRLIGEDVELVTVLDAALGRVKADPAQLEQVILNLAVNSRDAMPQGGRLTIETANVELDADYTRQHAGVSPGPHVVLAVSDTGCGMDAETRARVFEPFFTTKGPGRGTGLGLSTVYGIVKQSGGHIWVYSEPGRGTTFKIYLPRLEHSLEPEGVRLGSDKARSPKGSETILLVEDEDGVRELVRDILQENGYAILEARGGVDAIRIFGRHAGPIHLLLTDVVMPQISGRALADRLVPLRPEMKVLYMSGYSENAIAHHGVLDHGTAYLQKPFSEETLVQKVREVLDTVPPKREEKKGPDHEFRVQVTQSYQATVIVPSGALDIASAAQMKRTLEELLDARKTKLIVDLGGVTYLDSAGLGELVRAMKRARDAGGDLRLCGLPEKVLQIFQLTQLNEHMTVYPARESAMASWE